MRRIIRVFTALTVLAGALIFTVPPQGKAMMEFTAWNCEAMNDLDVHIYSISEWIIWGPVDLKAGDHITMTIGEGGTILGSSSPAKTRLSEPSVVSSLTVNFYIEGTLFGTVSGSPPLVLVVNITGDISLPLEEEDGDPNMVVLFENVIALPEDYLDIETSCTRGTAVGGGSAVPGCDVLLDLPSTAVGGSFVADAPIYWQPGSLTSPLVVIPAGNTARVLGVDDSGQYRKIIWGCDFVWVDADTLAPNYDDVWQGRPLPTVVVE